MTPDERFDERLRAALEWRAEQDARRAPSLETSVRAVAERLGPEPPATGPMVSLRPGTGRSVQLVGAVILLVILVAAALAIGSLLVRIPPPNPLGFGAECGVSLPDDVLMEVQRTDRPVTLYANDLFVTDLSRHDETLASHVDGALLEERRLTPDGRQRIMNRVSEAGLTPGCRTWRTQEAQGSITALTPDGVARINWGPGAGEFTFARVATIEEEAQIDELAAALQRPDTWLPADAWLDAAERQIVPDQWVVIIGFIDTELPPGARIGFPSGLELDGSDPRYGRLAVPGGVPADEFGVRFDSPFSPAPRSMVRCGVVGREETLRLAESVDDLALDPAGGDSLHNDDLTAEVSFDIEPAFPESYDCETAIGHRTGGPASPTATAGPPPKGEFADVDPCRLASDAVLEVLGATTRTVQWSGLPVGVPARACYVSGEFTASVRLVLYPEAVDRAEAGGLAQAVFGDGVVEDSMDGRPVWIHKCFAESLNCAGAIAVLSEPYFMLIEFGGGFGSAEIDDDEARAVVLAVLDALPR